MILNIKMTKKKCSKCQKVYSADLFGIKNNTTFFSRCISCREKERNSYTHVKISFLDKFPKLKSEWDFVKNAKNNIYPEKLSAGSHKKVFWKMY